MGFEFQWTIKKFLGALAMCTMTRHIGSIHMDTSETTDFCPYWPTPFGHDANLRDVQISNDSN
jgi:hypothetical protein